MIVMRRVLVLALAGAAAGAVRVWLRDRKAPPQPPQVRKTSALGGSPEMGDDAPKPTATSVAAPTADQVETPATPARTVNPYPTSSEPAAASDAVESPSNMASLPWVLPAHDGTAPGTHPIKANARSRIYHVPGGRSYDRTKPERCYATPEAAEADGYRRAKA